MPTPESKKSQVSIEKIAEPLAEFVSNSKIEPVLACLSSNLTFSNE